MMKAKIEIVPCAVLWSIACVLATACGGNQGPPCDPGDQIQCDCGSGVTAQTTCLADGSGYGVCPCANAGSSDAGGGSGGVTGNGGAGETTGSTSDSSSGNDNCVATCCDGSVVYSSESTPQDCKFYGGFACQSKNGPSKITHEGNDIWHAPGGCPSMRDCTANCCDGTVKSPGQHFDVALCNFLRP